LECWNIFPKEVIRVMIRLATFDDIDELVQMRWDFSEEENPRHSVSFEEFYPICSEFLRKAMNSGDWYIWIAEVEGRIVSHMYLQLIHKVPRRVTFYERNGFSQSQEAMEKHW
jgi:hypothetical protein